MSSIIILQGVCPIPGKVAAITMKVKSIPVMKAVAGMSTMDDDGYV